MAATLHEPVAHLTEEQRQRSALDLIAYVEHPHTAHAPKVRNEDFVAEVEEVPQLSEDYIHKYLDDMQLLGLLPPAR